MILKTNNLCKCFKGQMAVNNLSLRIERNFVYGLLGPNGAVIYLIRELIRSFPKNGITVILSSHILHEVQQIADHIGIISDGVLGYSGKIKPGEDLETLFMQVVKENEKNLW